MQFSQAFLPKTVSRSCAAVMRDGIAFGFKIKSGTMPFSSKGKSSFFMMSPTVPFCADLDANLSPIIGCRSILIFILTNLRPSALSSNRTLSIKPDSELKYTDLSIYSFSKISLVFFELCNFETLPRMQSPFLTKVLSKGNPSLSIAS